MVDQEQRNAKTSCWSWAWLALGKKSKMLNF